jgi:predicted GNAT family acetyltransferase
MVEKAEEMENLEVVDDPENGFYELLLGGERIGVLVYSAHGTRRVITHTGIVEDYRGRGLADHLIRTALDDMHEKLFTIANFCPAVDRFLTSHPEYGRLVERSQSGLLADER